jgi:hypothetical protein
MGNEKTLVQVAERIAEGRQDKENMEVLGRVAVIAILVGLVVLFIKGPIQHRD